MDYPLQESYARFYLAPTLEIGRSILSELILIALFLFLIHAGCETSRNTLNYSRELQSAKFQKI